MKNRIYSLQEESFPKKDGWGDVHLPNHPFWGGFSVRSVSNYKNIFGIMIFLSFCLAACNSPEPTVIVSPSPSVLVESNPTSPLPTLTTTISPSPTIPPTHTLTPSPSPTAPLAPIDLQNAEDLNVIRALSLENCQDIAWAPGGEYFAYADTNLLVILDTNFFGIVHELEAKNEFDVPEEIYAIEFLDDQFLLFATASAGSGIQVYDVQSGAIVETWPFAPKQNGIYDDLEISPDGKLLAITYFWFTGTAPGEGVVDGFVDVWNIETKTKIATLNNGLEFIREIVFSPDGKWLGMLGDVSGLTLFDTIAFHAVMEYHPVDARGITFHPNGTLIYLVLEQSLVAIDLQTGDPEIVVTLSGDPVKVLFSPANSVFVVAKRFGKLDFWVSESDQRISRDFRTSESLQEIAFDLSGKILALADTSGISFIATGNELPTPTPRPPTDTPAPTDTPTPLPTPTPRPTGTPISIADAIRSGDTPLISAENAGKLQHVANFVFGRQVNDVVWSPDGTKLMFTNFSEGVDIYTFSYAQGLQNTQIIPAWDTNSFAISPDGSKIAKRNNAGQFEIFDTTTNEILQVVGGAVDNPLGASIAWSPLMDVLATMYFVPFGSGSVPEIRIYDLTTAHVGAYAREDILQTEGLVFSPGGTLIATTSGLDGNTYVWNRNTGKIALALYGSQPSFSPNSEMIATRGTDTLSLYAIADGSLITSLDAPLSDASPLAETAFSPDNTLIVATGTSLSVWSLPDGTFVTEFEAQEPYTHVVFSPDGKLLVTVRGEGAHTRVVIWAVLP